MGKKLLKGFSDDAIGLTKVTIATGVGGAIGGKLGANTSGFATIGSFTGIATTASSGKRIIDTLKTKKKKGKTTFGMY